MQQKDVSWKEFKKSIEADLEEKRWPKLARGQADSTWSLKTSFHRLNQKRMTLRQYFEQVLPVLADYIGSHEKRRINLSEPQVNGAFLAYVQHYGFPTPLLDWTFSPFMSAYHAFSVCEELPQESQSVSIYLFDYLSWCEIYQPILDYRESKPHVSLLYPQALGNLRQLHQQGIYFFTNIEDIEKHIEQKEKESRKIFLEKYNIPISEKPRVLADLEVMGINALSLFGGTEGVCRYFKESVFQSEKLGESPPERLRRFLGAFQHGSKDLIEESKM